MPRKQSLAKVFLQPGWVITTLAVLAFAYIAFTVLAPWQLGKNEATNARNSQITAAFEHEPVDYQAGLEEWRRVRITGHYLGDKEVVLRLRPVNSKPAHHALTPFELDNGQILVVNRGYQDTTDFAPAPTGEVTITAHVRRTETGVDPNITASHPPQVNGIDTRQLAGITGLKLEEDYLQLVEDQPGVVQALPLPQLETGPYLSYGIQWIAFGIMAPLGLGYFIYAEIRERRREEEENGEVDSGKDGRKRGGRGEDGGHGEPSGDDERGRAEGEASSTSTKQGPKTRPHARYGNNRIDHYRKIAEKNQERF